MQPEAHTNASKKRGGKIATKNTPVRITAPVVATDYMTTHEAAAYVKLSRQFLEGARYRGDGSGPAYIKLGKRAVRYRRSALDAWMSAHDHSPDKPILARLKNGCTAGTVRPKTS